MAVKSEEKMSGRLKRRFSRFRMSCRSDGSSSYERMGDEDADGKTKKMKKKSFLGGRRSEKENESTEVTTKEPGKEKKKKKGWKRVRQAALTTCRYIGLGAAGLSPAAMYCSPDYSVDPRYWDRSFGHKGKNRAPAHRPQLVAGLMFSGIC